MEIAKRIHRTHRLGPRLHPRNVPGRADRKKKKRICLKCGEAFAPKGRFNRLCPLCKETEVFRSRLPAMGVKDLVHCSSFWIDRKNKRR